MAMLFGYVPAARRRLRYQLLLSRKRRRLCKPVSAVSTLVDAERNAREAYADHTLSAREHDANGTRAREAGDIHSLRAYPRMGRGKNHCGREWKPRADRSSPRKIPGAPAHVERQRPHRNGNG